MEGSFWDWLLGETLEAGREWRTFPSMDVNRQAEYNRVSSRYETLNEVMREYQRFQQAAQVDSVGESTWQYLSTYQQRILRVSANQIGATILRNEEGKIREARQLEDMNLVTIEFNPRSSFSGAYWVRITPEGRKVLSQKESESE